MGNYSSSSGSAGIFILILLAVYGLIMLVALAFGIVSIIAYWKLFEKAGEPGWKAIIPYYNTFKLAQIATGSNLVGWILIGLSAVYLVLTVIMQVVMAFFDSDDPAFMLIMILFYLLVMVFSLGVAGLSGYTHFMLGKSFGKPTVWNVLMIFFAPFLIIAMGFDKNLTYIGPKGEPVYNYYT